MMRSIFISMVIVLVGPAYAAAQSPEQVAAGKAVFEAQKCSMCHQVAGKGNKMYPLDGVGTKLSEADLRMWITNPAEMEAKLESPPRLKMSAREFDLEPADIDALVAYLKTLK